MIEKQSTLDMVRDAISGLHNESLLVTSDAIKERTGLPATTIKDRIDELLDAEEIVRLYRGVFAPQIRQLPPRAIYHTVLPDGTEKWEIGDECMTLRPAEVRHLAATLVPKATQHVTYESHQAVVAQTGILTAQVKFLRERIKGLQAKEDHAQERLIFGGMHNDS